MTETANPLPAADGPSSPPTPLDVERRALLESAAVYRMHIEQSGDGIVVVESSTLRIVEANESAAILTGYSREELLQMRSSDLIVPEDLPLLLGLVEQIDAGHRMVATRRLLRKDGTLFWGELITNSLSDGRRLTIVRNVNERLRLDAERSAILDRVTDAFFALDADGRFTWVNEKGAAIFDRTPDELLGRNMFVEFADVINAPLRDACERVMRDQVPVTLEGYYAPHDRWYEDRIFPSANGLSLFSSDITVRKKADAVLNVSEAKFRVLVEQGADAVFMLDRTGVVTWCSPSVQRVLGYAPSDLVGRMSMLLLHPEDRDAAQTAFQAAMRQPGFTAVREFRAMHRDGSLRTISGFGVNRFDDPVFGAFVGSWHDITDQRAAEKVLVGAADQLRRLTQRLQVVREEEQAHLSRELHDRLGQSLTMLKLGLARVSALIATDADTALSEAQALMSDVDSTIHATRQISADLRPPLLDDFGLAAALDWAGQRFTAQSGLPCQTKLDECDLATDVARAMYAIAQEALTNVVRHARATRVSITLTRSASLVQLDVHDNGVGIPWSATAPDTDSGSLGLLGMRERAVAVGAGVVVYPGATAGTTVSIRLPVAGP
jgi:PAS domain S-box-containing protein